MNPRLPTRKSVSNMVNTHAKVVVAKGKTLVREDWELPRPKPNEIVIKVKNTGLNFADLLMIGGTYQEMPDYPFVPGLEISGRITELGADVTGLTIGQRVAAFCGHGGLAGYAVTQTDRCIRLPDTLDDITAAGFQIAYGTSHLALTRRANLQPGQTLVVLGASGGVGLTAVEIGKLLGARVIGVARGADKLAIAKAAGADVLIDSDTDDLVGALRTAGMADVVYDAVGGQVGQAALRALAPEGRFILIGFASGDLPELKPNHLLVKNSTIIGFHWGAYLNFNPGAWRESLTQLIAWHSEGLLKPHISHVLPFAQIDEGLDLLRTRQATGKVVISL